MIDILWDAFIAKLISIDKNLTASFTRTHHMIMETSDGFECGRTNNEQMYKNLQKMAEDKKNNLVDVGIVYYIIYGYKHGLGWV